MLRRSYLVAILCQCFSLLADEVCGNLPLRWVIVQSW